MAKTAPVISTYTFEGPNLAPSETWTTGVRTPYGLAFAPDGRLWEVEHGPRGGDELNLIEPGKNYGWPLVSYAVNYNGVPIPSPDTRPDLTKPVIYWTPIIAPGNLTFYNGAMFPQWKGSALMGGMQTQTLNRITFDGKGGATPAERWNVGHRIRDVEVGPDGALWMLEDAQSGRAVPRDAEVNVSASIAVGDYAESARASSETILKRADTPRNASTTAGSKCVPRPLTISPTVSSCDKQRWYSVRARTAS